MVHSCKRVGVGLERLNIPIQKLASLAAIEDGEVARSTLLEQLREIVSTVVDEADEMARTSNAGRPLAIGSS
jgi:hypothetical protein